MTSIRASTRAIVPGWMRSYQAERFIYAITLPLDEAIEWVSQGIKARFPLVADATVLPVLGRDRRITRGLDEAEAAYRARLVAWRDAHRRAGTAKGLMDQLAAFLAPHAVRIKIVTNTSVWYTRETDGSFSWERVAPANWDWDGAVRWWRFWVILYPPASGLWVEGPTLGNPHLWGGQLGLVTRTIGSTASLSEVEGVRAVVAQWKPANAVCEKIIIAFDDASFDASDPPGAPLPDGTWGRMSTGFDPSEPTRLETARYWDGVI